MLSRSISVKSGKLSVNRGVVAFSLFFLPCRDPSSAGLLYCVLHVPYLRHISRLEVQIVLRHSCAAMSYDRENLILAYTLRHQLRVEEVSETVKGQTEVLVRDSAEGEVRVHLLRYSSLPERSCSIIGYYIRTVLRDV